MPESLSTLLDLFTRGDFQAGLIAGALGLAVLLLISNEESPATQWGEAFALAVVVVVGFVAGRRLGVGLGLAVLAAGGWLLTPQRAIWMRAVGGGLVAGGAALVAWRGGLGESGWLPLLTAAAILIGGTALATWSLRLPHGLLGPMMAITAFGIWVTVPETEHARMLLGVSLPLAVATLRPALARLSVGGAFALAGAVVWIVAVDGQARPGSIIGGWACLGALALFPFVQPNAASLIQDRPLIVIGIHTAFVIVASRVIGLWESAVTATIGVLIASIVAFVAIGLLTRRHASTQGSDHGPE
ncbi:MAG TPA: hypothetical protein VIC07_05630 [Acidimicrobiia bacterium]|jgi:hypothetical protein